MEQSWDDLLERAAGNEPDDETPTPICLADVVPRRVDWLWHPYLATGKLSLLEGDPGQGKSYLTAALATALSLGRGLPGWEAPRPPSRTLMYSTEDGLSDTLRPRLDDMEADVGHIHAWDKAIDLSTTRGITRVAQMVADLRPALVTIDPIVSYVGSDTDTYRANEVRSIMAPLARIAEDNQCSILALRHLNKGSGAALYRGQGSIDFAAAARSVLLACPDNEKGFGNKHLVQIKNNLAPMGPTQGYKLDRGRFYWDVPLQQAKENLF